MLIVVAIALGACGRRGSLEAPPGSTSAASPSSPTAASRLTPGIAGSSARLDPARTDPLSSQVRPGEGEEEPPVPAPDRPFILDAIL